MLPLSPWSLWFSFSGGFLTTLSTAAHTEGGTVLSAAPSQSFPDHISCDALGTCRAQKSMSPHFRSPKQPLVVRALCTSHQEKKRAVLNLQVSLYTSARSRSEAAGLRPLYCSERPSGPPQLYFPAPITVQGESQRQSQRGKIKPALSPPVAKGLKTKHSPRARWAEVPSFAGSGAEVEESSGSGSGRGAREEIREGGDGECGGVSPLAACFGLPLGPRPWR